MTTSTVHRENACASIEHLTLSFHNKIFSLPLLHSSGFYISQRFLDNIMFEFWAAPGLGILRPVKNCQAWLELRRQLATNTAL